MKVDKGANTIAVPFGGVCAVNVFLSVIVESEKDFVFHVFYFRGFVFCGKNYFSDFSNG